MRNLILAIVAAVVAVGGYLWYTGQSPQDAVSEAGEAIGAPAALDSAAEAVGAAAEAAGDAAEGAVEAVGEAAEAAAEAATEAAEEVTDAVAETAEAVGEAAEAATDAVADTAEAAADTAAEAATDTAAEATETATDTAAEAAATATEDLDVTQLLTVDGFDFDKVVELIDGSEMNMIAKTAAKTALEQARNNPDLLKGSLDGLREQLGL